MRGTRKVTGGPTGPTDRLGSEQGCRTLQTIPETNSCPHQISTGVGVALANRVAANGTGPAFFAAKFDDGCSERHSCAENGVLNFCRHDGVCDFLLNWDRRFKDAGGDHSFPRCMVRRLPAVPQIPSQVPPRADTHPPPEHPVRGLRCPKSTMLQYRRGLEHAGHNSAERTNPVPS